MTQPNFFIYRSRPYVTFFLSNCAFIVLIFQDLVSFVQQQAVTVEEQSKTIREQSTAINHLQIILQEQSRKNEQQSVTIDKQSALIEVCPLHCQICFCGFVLKSQLYKLLVLSF